MTTPSDKDRDEAPRIGSGYRDWEWAAHRLGEMMCADGPKGYYLFTPQQLVDWASSLPSRTVPETQPREGDDHPGPIAPLKGDTPRTDARWNELYDQGGNTITWFEVAERVRDFARQLEREVIAWQRQAKAMARAADNEKRRADAAPLSAKQAHSKTEYKRLVAQGANVVLSDNAAPGSGGQQPGTTDSKESPAGERCPVAAPLSTSGALTLELADELFGAFLRHGGKDGYECVHCRASIDPVAWIDAAHEPDCIVEKARAYLKIHKPSAVQSATGERVIGFGGNETADEDGFGPSVNGAAK